MDNIAPAFDSSVLGDGPPPTLRPSVRQYAPVFSEINLTERLSHNPLHVATLLRFENLKSASRIKPRQVSEYLLKRDDEQRQLLTEALMLCGVTEACSRAVSSVPREAFVRDLSQKPFANLNHTIPFSSGSWLTPQFLVGLMIDRLNALPGQSILEIGSGAGFHLASLHHLLNGECQLSGIEMNRSYCEFGISAIAKVGFKSRIQLLAGDGSDGWPDKDESFDRMYCTAALREPLHELPVAQLRDGGLLQCVRAFTSAEYDAYPITSRLRHAFPSFEMYRAEGWQRYCCLATSQKRGSSFVEIDRLFDVRFVPYYHSPHSGENGPIKDLFSDLRKLF